MYIWNEDQGWKNVKVRSYKYPGKGCGEVRNLWSACDAHINKTTSETGIWSLP